MQNAPLRDPLRAPLRAQFPSQSRGSCGRPKGWAIWSYWLFPNSFRHPPSKGKGVSLTEWVRRSERGNRATAAAFLSGVWSWGMRSGVTDQWALASGHKAMTIHQGAQSLENHRCLHRIPYFMWPQWKSPPAYAWKSSNGTGCALPLLPVGLCFASKLHKAPLHMRENGTSCALPLLPVGLCFASKLHKSPLKTYRKCRPLNSRKACKNEGKSNQTNTGLIADIGLKLSS